MARATGRDLLLEYTVDDGTTYTALASCWTSQGITKTNEQTDITAACDDGWRTRLEEPSNRFADLSIEGYTDENFLMTEISKGTSTIGHLSLRVTEPNGDTHEGDFSLNNIEGSASHDGAYQFTATLESSGEVTFTAA